MTALKKYRDEVDYLIDRLDNMSFGFTDEIAAIKLMTEASEKLKILSNILYIGDEYGLMAKAFQIISDGLEK